MSEIKLLPCPFCNGIAKLETIHRAYDGQLYCATFVECQVCHAKSKEVWNTQYDNRPNDREKEVIEKWNRRKSIELFVDGLKEKAEESRKLADAQEVFCEYESARTYMRVSKAFSEAIEIVKEEGGIE